MVKNVDLMKFMMGELGGEEAVHSEYAKSQLMRSVSGGATIGSVITQAEKEGWKDILLATPISTLVGQGATRRPTKRMTQAEKDKVDIHKVQWDNDLLQRNIIELREKYDELEKKIT